jgi:hypothetical protein
VSKPGSSGNAGRKHSGPGSAQHSWLENLGLIIIAILILAITITRYWHNIHWSTR